MAGLRQAIRDKIDDEPIILTHHPLCDKFSDHVMEFRGYKLCIGCFFTYPAAIVTLLFFLFFNDVLGLDSFALMIIGISLFLLNITRKAVPKVKLSKKAHVFFRLLLGGSLGSVIAAVLIAPDNTLKTILAIVIISVAAAYNVYNGIHNMNICKNCEEYSQFPRCRGGLASVKNIHK